MAKYFDNVLDIIDFWGGPPAEGGYSTESFCTKPALNSGIVKLECFINSTCPFYKTPKKEDGLIFNDLTFENIKDKLQNGILNVLDTTPGLEGIHFKPRYVFRHNYLFRAVKELDPAVSHEDRLGDKWDEFFEEITDTGSFTQPLVGVNDTRYKRDQSWYIIPSVFDDNSCITSLADKCNQGSWSYQNSGEPDSDMNGKEDLINDYNTKYYNDYVASYDSNNSREVGETERILLKRVQMPTQQTVHNNKNSGVHWRVKKRTPLFKGEDFFIRFRKQAQESNVFSGTDKDLKRPFNNKHWYALDITRNDPVIIDPLLKTKNGEPFTKYANDAVRFPGDKNEDDESKAEIYNFFTQAYYIIEFHGGGTDQRYFIIITERGNPIFVHFFKGRWAKSHIAKMLGKPFEGISGEKLIKARWFDVVVRNHLGRLVIQFRGEGISPPPWIVERRDWTRSDVPDGETPILADEFVPLIVPYCRLSIWGGNIKTGFIFSPLQYKKDYITFPYPPRELEIAEAEDMKLAWEADSDDLEESSTYFQSLPFFLPLNRQKVDPSDPTKLILCAEHDILFHAGPPGIKDGGVGDNEPPHNDKDLFTADAQFYRNYVEEENGTYQPGYFYYDKTIRGFPEKSDTAPSGEKIVAPGVKASRIVITKYKYLNNEKTRHQGFDVLVGMMCGDHVFIANGSNVETGTSTSYDVFGDFKPKDDSWYLPNCKTPIIPLFRLLSSASEETRWDDNTSIKEGIKRLPENNTPYFADASDHVLSFGHSWTRTGNSQMEHTGSIQFYLNRSMESIEGTEHHDPININNVTDYLLSLQDKCFYIEIWAGYDSPNTTASGNPCNYTRIPGLYKMFTGVCQGGSISYEYGKIIMNCVLEDYSTVLKDMLFFNSPWFDGMQDVFAINEILQFAGFRDQGIYDPGELINWLTGASTDQEDAVLHAHLDGRVFKFEPFVLPSGYNRLEQPAFKFNEGDPFIDAISKIAKLSSKIFYFDEFGIAHYEDYQDMVEKDFDGGTPLVPLYQFTSNPSLIGGHMVFNKMERSFDVANIYNHIKVMTSTPDMRILIGDHLNWKSMENPDMTGFLGYQKTRYQAESLIGSKEAQVATIRKYSVGFKPKVGIKFETYGLPLRATDIISIGGISSSVDADGNLIAEIVRVIKVNHTFDPKKNRWWMEVECERYQPISAADIV